MLHRLPRRPAGLVAGLPIHLRICLTALLALILSAPPAAAAVCPGVTPSGCLEIHYINVQQGTSTFVVGPGGITLLLDAGGNGKGNTQIAPYLGSIGFDPGVDAFTYTLSSHLDADHIGGFDDLFVTQGYDVTLTNWYNGSDKTGSSISDYFGAPWGPPPARWWRSRSVMSSTWVREPAPRWWRSTATSSAASRPARATRTTARWRC